MNRVSYLLIALLAGAVGGLAPHASDALAGPKTTSSPTTKSVTTDTGTGGGGLAIPGKGAFYLVQEKGLIICKDCLSIAEAKCHDVDDIPISGACHGGGAGEVAATRHRYWTTTAERAAFECGFRSLVNGQIEFTSEIVCMRYGDK